METEKNSQNFASCAVFTSFADVAARAAASAGARLGMASASAEGSGRLMARRLVWPQTASSGMENGGEPPGHKDVGLGLCHCRRRHHRTGAASPRRHGSHGQAARKSADARARGLRQRGMRTSYGSRRPRKGRRCRRPPHNVVSRERGSPDARIYYIRRCRCLRPH